MVYLILVTRHTVTLLIHLMNDFASFKRALHLMTHLIEAQFVIIGFWLLSIAVLLEDVRHQAPLHILLQPRIVLIKLILHLLQQFFLPFVLAFETLVVSNGTEVRTIEVFLALRHSVHIHFFQTVLLAVLGLRWRIWRVFASGGLSISIIVLSFVLLLNLIISSFGVLAC